MRGAFIVIVMLLGSLANGQVTVTVNSPSTQNQIYESGSADNKPKADQRGTEQSPLVVKVAPSPNADEEAAAEAQARKDTISLNRESTAINGRLLIATWALVGIGFLQLVVFGIQSILLARTVNGGIEQSKAMERHIEQAGRQADAMEKTLVETAKSADAAAATVATMRENAKKQLRAYVQANVFSLFGCSDRIPTSSRIRLTNFGQTPAHKVRCRLDIVAREEPVGDDFELPEIKNGWTVESVLFPNTTTPRRRRPAFVQPSKRAFTAEEIMGIMQGKLTIYVYGQVAYVDIFGDDQEFRFCCGMKPGQVLGARICDPTQGEIEPLAFRFAPMFNTST